jgi:uncharacterized membrane protein
MKSNYVIAALLAALVIVALAIFALMLVVYQGQQRATQNLSAQQTHSIESTGTAIQTVTQQALHDYLVCTSKCGTPLYSGAPREIEQRCREDCKTKP